MHGLGECLGNMISLCANDLYPSNTIVSLGFTNCLTISYPRIPERSLVQSCALEHGIDFGALNTCVSQGGKGMSLLRSSIERSKEAGIQRSCTIRVKEKIWCVRDGGKWKGCSHGSSVDDLVSEVLRDDG